MVTFLFEISRPSSTGTPTTTTTGAVPNSSQTTNPSGDQYAQLLRQMFGMVAGATNPSVSGHKPNDENIS